MYHFCNTLHRKNFYLFYKQRLCLILRRYDTTCDAAFLCLCHHRQYSIDGLYIPAQADLTHDHRVL